MNILEMGIAAIERGWVPDVLTRTAIRGLCSSRLRNVRDHGDGQPEQVQEAFIETMRRGPIALAPRQSNQQHYELPPEFFENMLGRRRKYSCCFWPDRDMTLDAAEEAALTVTCQRAGICDGQDILELGCGWGSLSLWMAEQYPHSRILAMSHSKSQRRYIEAQIQARGITNLRVLTADINDFAPPHGQTWDGQFDRVVSVEMFEHLRNYELLLARVASWLRSNGQCFVHIFCHRDTTYPFESRGASDWMAQYFFTGGLMPGSQLLQRFQQHLCVRQQWIWNGSHYQRTAEAWLKNLDAQRDEVLPILRSVYGAAAAPRWLQRWRVFLLAVAELFGFNHGEQWFVSHYLLEHATHSRPKH